MASPPSSRTTGTLRRPRLARRAVVSAVGMDIGPDTTAGRPPRPIVTRYSSLVLTTLLAGAVIDEMMNRRGLLHPERSHLIVTPNMHHLAMLQRSDGLASAYAAASMLLPDGWPVVRLANALGSKIERRVTGSDLVSLLAASDGTGRRIHLIGGSSALSLRIAEDRFVQAGWAVGSEQAPADWLADPANIDELRRRIDAEQPHIVLVGLGTPKQEVVAEQLRLGSNTAVFICVGAGIDFLSGEKVRAPAWMQRAGLEWLHRILSEPGRLLRRYIDDVPPFLGVMASSFGAGMTPRRHR